MTAESVTLSMPNITGWTPDMNPFPLRVDLEFSPHRPYECRATITTDPGTAEAAEVVWVFGRDLLAKAVKEGISGEQGGDVHAALAGDYVVLRIESPEGKSFLRLPRQGVARWVERAFESVPHGAEFHYHGDVDGELRRILQGAS